jgi:transposase
VPAAGFRIDPRTVEASFESHTALLWEEYRQAQPDGYRYSRFCELYERWRRKQEVVLRQEHKAGEKLFVDWAGDTIPIYDPRGGPTQQAHLFVAVLGASSYSYAEATPDEQLASWIGAHVRAFEFFQGTPNLVVPDNARTGVTKACRYDPDLNPTYQEMAMHYGIGVVPARPYKPRDRPRSNQVCSWPSAGSSPPCAIGSSSPSRS